jgi:hypothetical protein
MSNEPKNERASGPGPGPDAAPGPRVDPPRALSLDEYPLNFGISPAARLRAAAGAPAFAIRRQRLDRALEAFWAGLERRRVELHAAAAEGRVDEAGRETRSALLDDDGRDTFAEREHRKALHKAGIGHDADQAAAFSRAWRRHVDGLDLEGLERLVDEYNHYFPIEANLKSDPHSGQYLWLGRPWEKATAPTRNDVLARFPPA